MKTHPEWNPGEPSKCTLKILISISVMLHTITIIPVMISMSNSFTQQTPKELMPANAATPDGETGSISFTIYNSLDASRDPIPGLAALYERLRWYQVCCFSADRERFGCLKAHLERNGTIRIDAKRNRHFAAGAACKVSYLLNSVTT